ncbi:MAG TPA: hypothetical protein PKY59_20505 [Pyrinomonadaceae bacterium]|nr:hypothetical protein [Pyrinomonadaceae bacterium]
MELFEDKQKEKKGFNTTFLLAIVIGFLVIGAGIFLLSRQPSFDEQKVKILEGSFLEGTPEFTEITKDILIETDLDKTIQSPTVFGTIMMGISGKIHNKGSKTINGLEVNVAVVTRKNEVLKEKRVLVVPLQQPTLEPKQTIPITLTLDGFSKEDDRANIRWKVTAIRTAN